MYAVSGTRNTKTKSGGDAKFVVVETHVVNNGKTSLDLTCSLPINTRLVDGQQRNFDPIEDLYKLKGNPECNKQLQPGFDSDMTWVYRVPVGAAVAGWAFQDTTDYAAPPGGFTVCTPSGLTGCRLSWLGPAAPIPRVGPPTNRIWLL